MLKKTITYEDFNGEQKTRDFYFHMNQVEFAKLNGEVPGGLEKRIQQITEDRDDNAMLRMIDLLVTRSYGKFDDDDEFTKVDRNGRPLYEKFVNIDAYDKLIIELVSGENNLTSFLKAILPKDLQNKLEEKEKEVAGQPRLTPVSPNPGN